MDVKKQISRIGWAYVAFYLVSVGIQLLIGKGIQLAGATLPAAIMSETGLMLLSQFSMYVFGFPVFYRTMKQLPCWHMQEKKRLTVGDFFLALTICLGTVYIGNLVGQAMMIMSDSLFGTQSINPVTEMVLGMDPFSMFLTTVIIAPIMEELMFRKLLIDRIVPCGQGIAVVISGVSFGLFHGNFYQFFYACTLGMIFAYLYSYTGRIRYNIALHMMINVIGGFLPLMMQNWYIQGNPLAMTISVALGMIMLFSVVGTIVLGCILGRKLTWFPSWIDTAEEKLVMCIVKAPGVWAFLAVSIIEFLVSY